MLYYPFTLRIILYNNVSAHQVLTDGQQVEYYSAELTTTCTEELQWFVLLLIGSFKLDRAS